jgi:murein DD-endopeptidase MepM/ murein hydrolase activator NlpD
MKYLFLLLLVVIAIGAGILFAVWHQVVVPSIQDVIVKATTTVPVSPVFQASSTTTSTIEATSTPIIPKISFLNPLIFQGDTLIAKISGGSAVPTGAVFDDRDLSVLKYGGSYEVVGAIGATEKVGYHTFSVRFADGMALEKKLYIRARKFPLVDLGVPEKLGVTAGELVQNLATEQSSLDAIVKILAPNIFFSHNFNLPLADNSRIVAPFGELRKSGDQLIRHMGIDFGAPKGSAVGAINDGIVREAENDPIYGNTVIVDHGAGIFSLYMHLDSISAKVGQTVKAGQVLGTVGETGYATGPHLHLSIKIDGVSVDPIKFVNIFR